MNIDEVDLQILRILYFLKKDETISTYSLAKKIFPDNKSEWNKKEFIIRRKLKDKLSKYGLIKVELKNCKYIYNLILNNIFITKIRKKKINLDSEIIFLKIKNRWIGFQT